MLGAALKKEIEAFYHTAKDRNPLFANAARGTITPEQINTYLANIHYLVSHTPVHLSLALRRAEERGMKELAVFFKDKIGEESGHDRWSEADMKKVADRFKVGPTRAEKPAEAMKSLIDYIRAVIDLDPSYYLAYILTSEYFTVLIAPQWLSDLEKHCGIPREMMSVVGNHAELDKGHVVDDMKQIEALFSADQSVEPLREVVRSSLGLFDRFAREVVGAK